MKVKALKSLIKEAVKEAVIEVLSNDLNNDEGTNFKKPSFSSFPSVKEGTSETVNTGNPLQQVLQETYHSMKSNPEELENFKASDFNVNLTSDKAQAFSPQQHSPVDNSPSVHTTKFEQDMMKKTAAIVGQMKKTGKLSK